MNIDKAIFDIVRTQYWTLAYQIQFLLLFCFIEYCTIHYSIQYLALNSCYCIFTVIVALQIRFSDNLWEQKKDTRKKGAQLLWFGWFVLFDNLSDVTDFVN